MKIFKTTIIILLLLLIYIILSLFSYSSAVSSNISDNVFRLHVIANSDSKEDQTLKYNVRDGLIKYMNKLCNNITSKEEAILIASQHTDDFYKIAKNIIIENGFNYDVNIEIGNFAFPTKTYGDISLPSGYYDALKVEIGEAIGQNWWCVMFPSLCFIDVTNGVVPDNSKEELESSLNTEGYNLISSNSPEYEIKFKLIEIFENTKIKLAQN